MRSTLFVTFCLAFALTRLAFAEDIVRGKAGKQHATAASAPVKRAQPQATMSVRNSAGQKMGKRFVQPNVNIRQNQPRFARPAGHGYVAMNVPGTLPANRPNQLSDQRGQDDQVGVTNRNGQRGADNDHPRTSDRRSYFDALKRHRHERHDRNWWNRHCRNIVFVNWGYYYLDAGYWYPAYGYNPSYDYYEYNGPIYTYANLLPDQVIANVQAALRDAGYYVGEITGSLNPATRAAIANYQRDYGLIITVAIDEPTVQSLGLN
jgi:hypothetical protein